MATYNCGVKIVITAAPVPNNILTEIQKKGPWLARVATGGTATAAVNNLTQYSYASDFIILGGGNSYGYMIYLDSTANNKYAALNIIRPGFPIITTVAKKVYSNQTTTFHVGVQINPQYVHAYRPKSLLYSITATGLNMPLSGTAMNTAIANITSGSTYFPVASGSTAALLKNGAYLTSGLRLVDGSGTSGYPYVSLRNLEFSGNTWNWAAGFNVSSGACTSFSCTTHCSTNTCASDHSNDGCLYDTCNEDQEYCYYDQSPNFPITVNIDLFYANMSNAPTSVLLNLGFYDGSGGHYYVGQITITGSTTQSGVDVVYHGNVYRNVFQGTYSGVIRITAGWQYSPGDYVTIEASANDYFSVTPNRIAIGALMTDPLNIELFAIYGSNPVPSGSECSTECLSDSCSSQCNPESICPTYCNPESICPTYCKYDSVICTRD